MINRDCYFYSHQILLYSGLGADKNCIDAIATALEEQLEPSCFVIKRFEQQPDLDKNVSLLIIPGGDASLITHHLQSNAKKIQDYILGHSNQESCVRGHSYWGSCAGAIVASSDFHWTSNGYVEKFPYAKLMDIFKCTTIAPMLPGNELNLLNYTACPIQWNCQGREESLELQAFHCRGPCFFPSSVDEEIKVIARYQNRVCFKDQTGKEFKNEHKPAAVIMYENKANKAKAIFAGIHPEITHFKDRGESTLEQKHMDPLIKTLQIDEKQAKLCVRDILARLEMPLKTEIGSGV